MKLLLWTFLLVATPLASSLVPQSSRHHHQPKSTNNKCSSRRQFVQTLLGTTAAATTIIVLPQPSFAESSSSSSSIPKITTDEFSIILRESARSIVRVEFSGPASDTVEVLLADGTRFGLSDVVESPFDPRSPLKVAALCRQNNVATKFLNLEAALAVAPKREKSYSNARVKEAAAKELEKKARMEQDELDRLAALKKMGS